MPVAPTPSEPDVAAQGLVAGSTIGERYRVLELIGQGGMAHVYEVEHLDLGRRFALKLLRSDLAREADQVERFQLEARAVARLESIHIVGMVDYGVAENGAPFFVMERLRGSDLRRLIANEGPLPAVRTVHLGLDACHALAVAHEAGIVHRDLKPENLFVTRDAQGRDLCKLLDFGIAKLSQGNPTSPGTYFGTARYMAPEQISTDQPIGPAADLFALGVTLFECLTCTHPFDADTLERVLFKIMNEPAPDLLALRPDLPPGLAALVTRLLAKKPAERPSSASTLAAELALFSPHARSAASSAPLETGRGVSVGSRDASRSGRSALLFRALLAGLALTLCIAGALLWARVRRMPPSNSPDVSARPSAALPSVEQREAASPPPIASAANLAVSPTPRSAPPAAPKPIPSAPDLPLFFPRQPKTR